MPLLYRPLPKPMPDGRTVLPLTPLELSDRIAAWVPAPRVHRHRYYGVLAPNVRRRPAVTALVCADDGEVSGEVTSDATVPEDVGGETIHRFPARYLWAMLSAGLYEVSPLTCPLCDGPMRIIAFIPDGAVIRHLLDPIGEPS
jgi:Putative transposase